MLGLSVVSFLGVSVLEIDYASDFFPLIKQFAFVSFIIGIVATYISMKAIIDNSTAYTRGFAILSGIILIIVGVGTALVLAPVSAGASVLFGLIFAYVGLVFIEYGFKQKIIKQLPSFIKKLK